MNPLNKTPMVSLFPHLPVSTRRMNPPLKLNLLKLNLKKRKPKPELKPPLTARPKLTKTSPD